MKILRYIGILALLGDLGLPLWGDACRNPTGIAAVVDNGQVKITWSDVEAGPGGRKYRYNLRRSTVGEITDLALTPIQTEIGYNSGLRNGAYGAASVVMTEAYRSDAASPMAIVQSGGSPLWPFTGFTTYTVLDAASSWWAVTAIATDFSCTESGIVSGQNATTSSVLEVVGDIQPVLQVASGEPSQNPAVFGVTGATGLPMFLRLHGSGGNPTTHIYRGGNQPQPRGDFWNVWMHGPGTANPSMGWREGLGFGFEVWEDVGRNFYPSTPAPLVIEPWGADWTRSLAPRSGGIASIEQTYFGSYMPKVAGVAQARSYPWIEARLAWLVPWARSHYGADPDRVYCAGYSMGAWGCSTWGSRQAGLFAAALLDRPRWRQVTLPHEVVPGGETWATASTQLMEDGVTRYLDRQNRISSLSCSTYQLPLVWNIGRFDGYATWQEHVDFINEMKSCHFFHAVAFSNGGHSNQTIPYAEILSEYANAFRLHESYPSFANSSLDGNIGTGAADSGDCQAPDLATNPPSCVSYVNKGWSWTISSDTPFQWSATIANSAGAATVDITAQNRQNFNPGPAQLVSWTTSTGDSGVLSTDDYGNPTIVGLSIPSGGAIVTMTVAEIFLPADPLGWWVDRLVRPRMGPDDTTRRVH